MLPPKPWEPVGRYYLKKWWEEAIEPVANGLEDIFWGGKLFRSNPSYEPARILRWGNLRRTNMQGLIHDLSHIQQKIYERDIPYEEHPTFC
jgi:hypothetical protein